MKEDIQQLNEEIKNSPLYSEDLAPIPVEGRTWSTWNLATLWVGMAVCIPTYMMAAFMITSGISWWGALSIIGLGNLIVTIPIVLNGHAGTKYGIPFPVVGRAAFGTVGIHIASLIRALVACGWFGIQTWLGGLALFAIGWILMGGAPADIPSGLGTGQFIGFGVFWLMNVYFIWKGTESIRWLEEWSAPILIGMGLVLIGWGWSQAGSFGLVLQQSEQLSSTTAMYNDSTKTSLNLHPLKDKNGVLKATSIYFYSYESETATTSKYHSTISLEGADLENFSIPAAYLGKPLKIQFAKGETKSSIISIENNKQGGGPTWLTYLGYLTAMVGFWGTMAISVADITRYVPTQKSQMMGQFIGLPGTMILYSFVGIFVTCAAIINFDNILIGADAPWDPVRLLNQFESKWVVILAQIFMLIATLSTNIAANVIAPANAFSNVAPKLISFQKGGYITAVIGILICPWWLLGSIIDILLFVSGLLGPVLGVLVADYYLVRKTNLNLAALYDVNGEYAGFNMPSIIALGVGVAVVLIGFFVPSLGLLYQMSWFSGFFVSLIIYWGMSARTSQVKSAASYLAETKKDSSE